MVDFAIHDENTAPPEVADALAATKAKLGFIPNMHGVLAESPQAYEGYQKLSELFGTSSLPKDAKHVVWLTASRANSCQYCMAAHSTMARQAKVDSAVVDALREGKPLPDARLEAVRRFTQAVLDYQGWVPEEETQAFLAAGFAQRQILDIVLGVAMKTLSNYTNHFAHTPVDEAFQAHAWTA